MQTNLLYCFFKIQSVETFWVWQRLPVLVGFCQTQFTNQLISQKQGNFEFFRILQVLITDEKDFSFTSAIYFENICEKS